MSHLDVLDRPIAYHRIFRTVSGSTVAALFLSQAWYWTKRLPPERDGWFYKTQAEWECETGLSRSEQETARRQLTKVGILEEKREGLPAKLWFCLDRKRLESLIDDSIKNAGILQTGSSESSNQDGGNPADIHTETTAENTAEKQRAGAREESATDNDQDDSTEQAPPPEPGTSNTLMDRFERWYRAYPKKRKRGDAEKAWKGIKPDDALTDQMIASVKVQRESHDWIKDGGQFIPYPATWLRAKSWLDEPEVRKSRTSRKRIFDYAL